MTDAELADALERLLWIGDPDPKRDNQTNLAYVATILEEHELLSTTTQDLVHILAPSGLWRDAMTSHRPDGGAAGTMEGGTTVATIIFRRYFIPILSYARTTQMFNALPEHVPAR